jgi:putative ABC transport system ATP-binding protein
MSDPSIPIIQMEQVSKVYKSGSVELEAVTHLDLEIGSGEMIAIIGPSGSGKSTLMNLIGCLDTPSHGVVRFEGHDVGKLGAAQLAALRNRSIGFVFQSFHLLPYATARENVEMPLLFAGMGSRQRRARALDLLEQVGLGGRQEHLPTQLSGGEMQRVAVARALACEPRVILADEPTGNLDTRTGRGILELFERIWKDQGGTIVLITHDLAIARRCSRIMKIQDGRIVHDGAQVPEEDYALAERV